MSDLIALDILDIGLIKRGYLCIETKNKECCVLSCRLTGSTSLNTGTEILNIHPGDILYIPKGASYSQKTGGEDIIYIHMEVLGNKQAKIQHIVPDNPIATTEFFKKIVDLWKAKDKNYKYICTSILYDLIAKTSVMLPDKKKDILDPALQYILDHFCDFNFSLEDACKQSHISRSYFNRLFKERFGITPALYINQLKIEKSKFLLSCKAYTPDEIANMCGFNNTKYFYTVFKQITKTTARKYQNAN